MIFQALRSIRYSLLILIASGFMAHGAGAERMAKPGMKNKALEQDMMDAIKREGWKETPLRAVITSTEWRVVRNPRTGIILRRVLNGQVAVKTPAGQCRVFMIGIAQEHDGSKFGKSHFLSVGDNFDIACEDVQK